MRNYIDWLLDLPWYEKTDNTKTLKDSEAILEEDHYGLKQVKERILEYLAVQSLIGKNKGSILCLVGPPGVGKTSVAKSIARATDRKFVRLSLGGLRTRRRSGDTGEPTSAPCPERSSSCSRRRVRTTPCSAWTRSTR